MGATSSVIPVRTPRNSDAFSLPRVVPGQPGRFVVDATWGTIRPMELAPGVRPVGELEVLAHLRRGLPVVDTRPAAAWAAGTIPGAASLPHGEAAGRLGEVDPDVETVVFCNGPQCAATPDLVDRLLAAGHPPERLLYYRG